MNADHTQLTSMSASTPFTHRADEPKKKKKKARNKQNPKVEQPSDVFEQSRVPAQSPSRSHQTTLPEALSASKTKHALGSVPIYPEMPQEQKACLINSKDHQWEPNKYPWNKSIHDLLLVYWDHDKKMPFWSSVLAHYMKVCAMYMSANADLKQQEVLKAFQEIQSNASERNLFVGQMEQIVHNLTGKIKIIDIFQILSNILMKLLISQKHHLAGAVDFLSQDHDQAIKKSTGTHDVSKQLDAENRSAIEKCYGDTQKLPQPIRNDIQLALLASFICKDSSVEPYRPVAWSTVQALHVLLEKSGSLIALAYQSQFEKINAFISEAKKDSTKINSHDEAIQKLLKEIFEKDIIFKMTLLELNQDTLPQEEDISSDAMHHPQDLLDSLEDFKNKATLFRPHDSHTDYEEKCNGPWYELLDIYGELSEISQEMHHIPLISHQVKVWTGYHSKLQDLHKRIQENLPYINEMIQTNPQTITHKPIPFESTLKEIQDSLAPFSKISAGRKLASKETTTTNAWNSQLEIQKELQSIFDKYNSPLLGYKFRTEDTYGNRLQELKTLIESNNDALDFVYNQPHQYTQSIKQNQNRHTKKSTASQKRTGATSKSEKTPAPSQRYLTHQEIRTMVGGWVHEGDRPEPRLLKVEGFEFYTTLTEVECQNFVLETFDGGTFGEAKDAKGAFKSLHYHAKKHAWPGCTIEEYICDALDAIGPLWSRAKAGKPLPLLAIQSHFKTGELLIFLRSQAYYTLITWGGKIITHVNIQKQYLPSHGI